MCARMKCFEIYICAGYTLGAKKEAVWFCDVCLVAMTFKTSEPCGFNGAILRFEFYV